MQASSWRQKSCVKFQKCGQHGKSFSPWPGLCDYKAYSNLWHAPKLNLHILSWFRTISLDSALRCAGKGFRRKHTKMAGIVALTHQGWHKHGYLSRPQCNMAPHVWEELPAHWRPPGHSPPKSRDQLLGHIASSCLLTWELALWLTGIKHVSHP